MRTGCIYIINNDINDKIYVGKTKQRDRRARWRNHRSDCNRGKQPNSLLYKAMRKYGLEHFDFKIIEEDIPENQLNKREQYWIKYYDSHNPNKGYNLTDGGDGGKTRDVPPNSKEVCQIDLKENKVLKTFSSLHEAARFLGNENYYQNIGAACRGKQKTAYGYRWSYKENLIFRNPRTDKKKIVYQIDIETSEILHVFDCVADAAEALSGKRENSYSTGIANCARGHIPTAYGYKWIYKERYDKENKND